MSIIIRQADESYIHFEQQVKEFNDKIKKLDLSEESIENIYRIVKEEVKRLEGLSDEVAKREEALARKEWCHIPISISTDVRNVALLNASVKIFEIGGFILTLTHENNIVKWIGAGIFSLGSIVDVISTSYEAALNLEKGEASELAKLNKEGIEHAKIFKKLLLQLRKMNRLAKKIEGAYEANQREAFSNSNIEQIDVGEFKKLERGIRACLKSYEKLPSNYGREEVYSFFISYLIQRLPHNDPLRSELTQLESLFSGDMTSELGSPPKIRYLPSLISPNSLEETPPPPNAEAKSPYLNNMWKEGEELPRLERSIRSQYREIEKEEILDPKIKKTYYLVKQRLCPNYNPNFLITPPRTKIDFQGENDPLNAEEDEWDNLTDEEGIEGRCYSSSQHNPPPYIPPLLHSAPPSEEGNDSVELTISNLRPDARFNMENLV